MNKRKDGNDSNVLQYRFTAWAETVLKHARIRYLYNEIRKIKAISLEDVEPDDLPYEIEPYHNDDFFFGNEKIYNAYKELSEVRRKILLLFFVKNMSLKEISDKLGVSRQYVKNVKTKAIKCMREKLMEENNCD